MIFVSYRSRDAFPVDQLVQALLYRFGRNALFQDRLSIVPGMEFPEAIARSIRGCRVMVVVIGPGWAGSDQRIQQADDWVRREIELAIAADRPILPVLLADAQMPRPEELPASLLPLLEKHALRLRTGEDTTGDLRRICAALRRHVTPDRGRLTREVAFMLTGMVAAGVGAAWWSSKALMNDYAPAQWPNVLLGIAAAVILPAIASLAALRRQLSAKWQLPRPLYRSPGLLGVWTAGAALLAVALAWPDFGLVDELYQGLEGTRDEMARVLPQVESARTLPRYAASEELRFIEQVARTRQLKDMTEDQANATLNFFAPYLEDTDARKRLWATLLSAVATRDPDRQIPLYGRVAGDPRATSFQRWYAYSDLGGIYYFKNERARARTSWEEALKYRRSRGLLENLAELEKEEGRWAKAAQRFGEALDELQKYVKSRKLARLADQEAVLYSNWCNMLRSQANAANAGDPAALRRSAVEKCEHAVAAYAPYLDAYWNLARVRLDAGEFDAAEEQLRRALETFDNLQQTSIDSLKRFGYAEYGDRYTLWLLVMSRFRAGCSLEDDTELRKSFRQRVVRLSKDPYGAVQALLAELEKRNLTLDEDKATLRHMREARYLTHR